MPSVLKRTPAKLNGEGSRAQARGRSFSSPSAATGTRPGASQVELGTDSPPLIFDSAENHLRAVDCGGESRRPSSETPGAVAQFGRALEWHSRGQEFDPPRLHPRPRGSNSAVECDLAKVEVAGSNPVSRFGGDERGTRGREADLVAVRVHRPRPFAESSNGKTADSGSAYRGSNPCSAVGGHLTKGGRRGEIGRPAPEGRALTTSGRKWRNW